MRTALAILTITIAFCLWGYLALSWGPLILREGFESAITGKARSRRF